jgi:hypothetical protein
MPPQGFGDIVLMDDIQAPKWPLMQDYWISGVPSSLAKINVTKFGHATGTGILVFNSQQTNVVVVD